MHGEGTTHDPSQQAGKKLYAVRDRKGRFKDIQTYERAHGADLRTRSKKEAGEEGPQEGSPEDEALSLLLPRRDDR